MTRFVKEIREELFLQGSSHGYTLKRGIGGIIMQGKVVTVHGLQLSVHGWKNQRISKFIVGMLIRFRSFLLPYSCAGPGNKSKISIFSLEFELCCLF